MRYLPLLLLSLTACRTYLRDIDDCPPGYAPIDYRPLFEGRALSPRGVVLAVREADNPQEASMEYWADVVKREMVEGKGYAFRSSREIGGGRALLFTAPREKNTAYYVALFVSWHGLPLFRYSIITTFEAAGDGAELDKDLPAFEDYIRRRAPG